MNSIKAITLFLAAQGFVVGATIIFYFMMAQVNSKKYEKISFWVIDIGKLSLVFEEHRRMFPNSRMYLYFLLMFLLMIVFFIAAIFFFFQR